jgi:hypothetical protein
MTAMLNRLLLKMFIEVFRISHRALPTVPAVQRYVRIANIETLINRIGTDPIIDIISFS